MFEDRFWSLAIPSARASQPMPLWLLQTTGFQERVSPIRKRPRPCWIACITFRDEDDHALASSGENYTVRILQMQPL
jgi:hypothetical protein